MTSGLPQRLCLLRHRQMFWQLPLCLVHPIDVCRKDSPLSKYFATHKQAHTISAKPIDSRTGGQVPEDTGEVVRTLLINNFSILHCSRLSFREFELAARMASCMLVCRTEFIFPHCPNTFLKVGLADAYVSSHTIIL